MELLTLEDKRKAVKNYCLKHKCSNCAIATSCDSCNSKPYMFHCGSEIAVLDCYDVIKNDEPNDGETLTNNESLVSQATSTENIDETDNCDPFVGDELFSLQISSAKPVIPEAEMKNDIDASETTAADRYPRTKLPPSYFLNRLKDPIVSPTDDAVNHPKHYQGKHECIEIMRAMFGDEAVKSFCRCNSFKYRFRADAKNKAEDIKKAEWYEDYLIKMERGETDK